MVTKITELNQLKYEDLFKRAWNELWYRGKFDQDALKSYYPNNTFTTLEDYFTKISTLIKPDAGEEYPERIEQYNGISFEEIDNPKYVAGASIAVKPNYEFIMFPIDEPRFEINADTREIAIPNNFKKLVGVQGDHVAETLIFSIDRFIDYYDLFTTSMRIYIQWKDEMGEDILTPISMIHYEAATQKILFGWPLTDTVTKESRNIDFSVRFIICDDDFTNVKYSFNTKPYQITVVKALQPKLTSLIKVDEAADSFIDAIFNSPSTEAPAAAEPSFASPGINLALTKDVGDNADELKVQAVVNGLGYINYTRWTKNGTNVGGTIEYRETEDTSRKDLKKYYTKKVGAENVYEVYTGSFPATKTLYEQFYIYYLPADSVDIVGTYKAYAQNQTSHNVSAEVGSAECVIPGPSAINYAENGDLKASVVEQSIAALTVVVNKTSPSDSIIYSWKYDRENVDMSEAITIPGENTYSVDTTEYPGYYQVIATPKRNRATGEPISSTICRVTGRPAAPTLAEPPITPAANEQDITDRQTIELTANVASITGAHLSDEFIYEWYGKISDGNNQQWIKITSDNAITYRADSGNDSYNSNILNVYGSTAEDDGIMYKYVVYNKLNGVQSAGTPLPEDNYITVM